jgi:hypothetical protein
MNNEQWQVIVDNLEYTVDLETLKAWIREGRVHRQDKVRKTGLSWTEARHAPPLREVFMTVPAAPSPPALMTGFPSAAAPGGPKRASSRTVAVVIGVIVVAVLGAVGGGAFVLRKLLLDGRPLVLSDGGGAQISVPKGWSAQTKLNDQAEIQAANFLKASFLIVLTEPKPVAEDGEEPPPVISLKEYADLTLKSFQKGADFAVVNETEYAVNDHRAIQRTVRFTSEGQKVKGLHVSVETPRAFHLIFVWTLAPRFDAQFPTFQKIVESFRSAPPGEFRSSAYVRVSDGATRNYTYRFFSASKAEFDVTPPDAERFVATGQKGRDVTFAETDLPKRLVVDGDEYVIERDGVRGPQCKWANGSGKGFVFINLDEDSPFAE